MKKQLRVTLDKFNSIWFVAGMRPVVFALAFLLSAEQDVWCAKRELRPPPMGETILVNVLRGTRAEITLKAFEGRANPLAYEIASLPKHGTLEQFQQADANKQGFASVIYVHGNDEESQEDEFIFRARALIGGGVSSPIKVRIKIVDKAPRLGVTPEADFRAVAGESDLQQIILANEGGGLIDGRVVLQEPFRVEGSDRFALRRGAMTNIFIRFSPKTTGGVPPQRIRPAPEHPQATITLRGEATPPFTVSAEPLELQADGSRTGTLRITNLSAAKILLELAAAEPGPADFPRRAEIPKAGQLEIPVVIRAERAGGPLEFALVISCPVDRQEVKLQAPGVPASLILATPELDFRTRNEAELIVRNRGGADGRFTIELPAEIASLEKAANFVVPAGGEKRVALRREEGNESGGGTGLVVDLGNAGKVPVPLLVNEQTPKPTPAQVGSNQPAEHSKASPEAPDSSPSKVAVWNQPATARKIEGIKVTARGTQADVTLTIADDREATGYRIERVVVGVQKDERTGKIKGAGFVTATDDAGKARITESKAMVEEGRKLTTITASLEGLPKGSVTMWRVVPMAGERALNPTSEFPIATAPPWEIPMRPLLIASLLAFLFFLLWFRHHSEKIAEA